MPSSRFSGLYLSGRTLALLVVILCVAGGMAFYRTHGAAAQADPGITSATRQPLPASAVSGLVRVDQEQERLAEYVAPAVVAVNVTSRTSAGDEDGDDEGTQQGQLPPDNPFSQFFGQFQHRQPFERGLGSGVIVSPDGYIVTNNHVISGATSIRVTLFDKRQFNATVVGTDPLTDLAVIRIEATNLPNLPWGDSKALKQGDNVYAFGNPFQFNFTMTHGIVSGKGRITGRGNNLRAPGDYIQTDAAVNPGNSGGPLVNSRGEVIGINSFIFTSTGSFSGESFAIPSEIARPITETLIRKGKVVRGYLGITIVPMTPDMAHFFHLPADAEGALVSAVTPGQAGARAGLEPGDLIVRFNNQKITDPTTLQLATGAVGPGTAVKLGILRNGKSVTLDARLGSAPGEETNAHPAAKPRPTATGVRLGMEIEDLTAQTRQRLEIPDAVKGAVIRQVTPGGPAYNANLQPGMIITSVDRTPVTDAAEVRSELQKLPPSEDVLLRLVVPGGDGGAIFVVVHPAPASSPAAGSGPSGSGAR